MVTGWHPDYGSDPLNLKPKDAAELKTLQNKELNNCRLAMLAAAGILAQDLKPKAGPFRTVPFASHRRVCSLVTARWRCFS